MLVSPFRIVPLSGDSQVSKIYGKQEQITTPFNMIDVHSLHCMTEKKWMIAQYPESCINFNVRNAEYKRGKILISFSSQNVFLFSFSTSYVNCHQEK